MTEIYDPNNGPDRPQAQGQELDIDQAELYEDIDTLSSPDESIKRQNNLVGELENRPNLSQRRIFYDVLLLNRISEDLARQGASDGEQVSFEIYKNYDTGLQRIIKHPKFDPEKPNFYAETLARGLQQQERQRTNIQRRNRSTE